MTGDELLLVAKLRGMEPTQDGRLIRALLDLLAKAHRRCVVAEARPEARPSCDCRGGTLDPPVAHESGCASHRTYAEHAQAAVREWTRANALACSLRALHDAVAAEVAIHPGMHDRVAAAFRDAQHELVAHELSAFPGDDGLPF